jgi:2-octaprenyl-6-methoxyphenol hydroxylase
MLHDVAIVGAGPVGATLALALADADLDIVVLDARARGETLRQDRSIALSHGARLVFDRLGVWEQLAAVAHAVTPIARIEVSQAGGFGRTVLDAEEQAVPALGYVVSYRALQSALDAALAARGIAVAHGSNVRSVGGTPAYAAVTFDDAVREPLLVRLAAVADGSGAALAGVARHRRDYGQAALIAKVTCAHPHDGLAYERFTPGGAIAFLPEGERYALVWTVSGERATELLELDDATFLEELARQFGPRSGRFLSVTDRRAFPLALEFAPNPTAARCVMLGNAAQTLHPVAGQGFNVGLRDAWVLAQTIADTPRERIGEPAMLARYATRRAPDRWAGIAFTHGLIRLFGTDLLPLKWPRGLALTLLDAIPAVKRAFTRAMLFGLR